MLPNSGLNKTKPATEIDNENRILLYIPSGKTSIASVNIEFNDRSGQKKGTCWYYAYSIIRVRYKDIEKISPPQEYIGLHQALLDSREKEQALSGYRKALTNLNQRREVAQAFLKNFDTPIAKTKAVEVLRRDTADKLDDGLKNY